MEEWKHYTGNRQIKDASGVKESGLRKMLEEIEEYV
jgi:hypothetical protein